MEVSIAIVNWNSGGLLAPCIESLSETADGAEILVIDNGSEDESLTTAQAFGRRGRLIRNRENRGFAAAVNQGFQATSSPFVLILNPDLRATPGAVQILEELLRSRPKAAAAGAYVGENYLPRPLPTAASLVLENLRLHRREQPPQLKGVIRVEQPAAAALMVRRAAYDEVGGFDEQFYPAWYEDVDFCRRLSAKRWELFFAREAVFIHEGGYSAKRIGAPDFLRSYYGNQLRYARKHFGPISAAAVRASIAAGMLGRMIGRPKDAAAYGKAFAGAVKGW